MARAWCFAALTIGLSTAGPAVATGPSLQDVVRRMAAYVDGYGDKASIVVATERYAQTAVNTRLRESNHREIVSDFAIVRTQERRWVGFRDVLQVDGKRVDDREHRLTDLLTSGGMALDLFLR